MSKITKQAIKHTGRGRKEEIVAELVAKIDNSKALVFTDYQGLTHIQLETLKKELKKNDATIIIAKNSLLKISLGQSKNYADFKDNDSLNLPTATLFMQGDYVEPLKHLQKALKDFGLPKIKFGILEGQALDESQVLKIASLPNRVTLLTQLAGTLNSPIQGLVVTLNGTIQKFVMTLGAIAANKPAAPADAPVTETPSETPAGDASSEATPPAPTETETAPGETTEEAPADQNTEATPASDEAPAETQANEETKPEEQTSEGGEN